MECWSIGAMESWKKKVTDIFGVFEPVNLQITTNDTKAKLNFFILKLHHSPNPVF